MRYGNDYGMDRGRMRGMRETGRGADFYGSINRGEPFRGREGAYDTYFRRDFQTNQGDFSDRFGGGRDYGYRGMDRAPGYGRRMEAGRGGYEPGSRGMNRGMNRGRDLGNRFGGETNYGPGYGNRRETTTGYDIAYRNFNR